MNAVTSVKIERTQEQAMPPGSGDGAPPSFPVGITTEMLDRYRESFNADRSNQLARNTVTLIGHDAAITDNERLRRVNHIYSHTVSHAGKATDQKSSGRCWLFAGLNVMRQAMSKEYELKADFEFSQSYLYFFDKLEKANFFLHNIIRTVDEPLDGRIVHHLLEKPQEDGGQWDMFVNLVQKYGVVPKSAFPESHFSSASRSMNNLLNGKLRDYAQKMRSAKEAGAEIPCLHAMRTQFMEEVYKTLVIMLGEPPKTFDWKYKTKKGDVELRKGCTPQFFAENVVPYKVDDKVCLIHDPRPEHPAGQLYTVKFLGNVEEGHAVRYISLPIDQLKAYAEASILRDEPVWFGCDVGRSLSRKMGTMDPDLLDYDVVYGTHVDLEKAQRLHYGESCMTHAMVLTGLDYGIDTKVEGGSGEREKWQVENSWGTRYGSEGYLAMSERGFDEDVFEVAIDKSLLDPEHLAVLEQEPIALDPWDPMGSLA